MSTSLAALERLRMHFGADAAARKLALLRRLARSRLAGAAAVRRLHEALCFVRAYPDDAAVLAQASAMLEGFARRADLRAHRDALADSGIAGTAIRYRFFAGQAQWLAARWPTQLSLDRSDRDAEDRIARALPPLLTHAEAVALREAPRPGYAALDALRGRGETDAVCLLRLIAAMPGDGFTREAASDAIDASYLLAPAPPSRSAAFWPPAPRVFRREPPPRGRPDLRAELARAPLRVRRLSRREGEAIVDLARAAMATRARSLEAFSFGDARDAWLVDDGDGLAYAFAGMAVERRHAVFACYGSLTLRNGVPVGYGQADVLGTGAALSFNTFESFRGAEAAYTFARWLAALRALFGCTSFTLEPYQLGDHNDEAIDSGAWWFYARLGFAPRDAATRALAARERARLQRRPRTPPAVLRQLAQRHLFFDLAAPRPLVTLAAVGDAIGAALTARAGSHRARGVDEAAAELLRLCGASPRALPNAAAREAWARFAPLVLLLAPQRWQPAQRRALLALARAKAARSERDFVAAWQAHPRLDAALLRHLAPRG